MTMVAFNNDKIEIGKKYIYLKNERTGSSTIRKLKMIGEVVNVKGYTVHIERLICAERTYFESSEKEIDKVSADDVICGITDKQIEERLWGG